MLTDLKGGPLDGVLLDLHGAMVPEGVDDGRATSRGGASAVGPDVPIAVTLDFPRQPAAT